MYDRIPAAVLILHLLSQSTIADAGEVPDAKEKKSGPSLAVRLIDADQKAKTKTAIVSVQVRGIRVVDSASVKEKPINGQGHLHYRLDNGPVIATTATKLSFHELSPGPHSFMVNLAGNDHSPLGPSRTVSVTIP